MIDGALNAVQTWPDVELLLVGPLLEAHELLSQRGAGALAEGEAPRVRLVNASQRIGMDEDPVRAVRAKRDASVRVAARLVRDGLADATVSVGSTGAAMAASLFTLGRLPGVTRPPLAVIVPAPRGPVVLVDAGATVTAEADLLLQFALLGAAYARVHLGVAEPAVGLLSVGSEPGKGDPVRREAAGLLEKLLADLPVRFVGNVESAAVAVGGVVDVVVTDGFTGNVLLKGMEGAVGAVLALAAQELDPSGRAALAKVGHRLGADSQGGAMLLGVKGIVVVGHGAASTQAVTACIGAAAGAVRAGLLPRLASTMDAFLQQRRGTHSLGAV